MAKKPYSNSHGRKPPAPARKKARTTRASVGQACCASIVTPVGTFSVCQIMGRLVAWPLWIVEDIIGKRLA